MYIVQSSNIHLGQIIQNILSIPTTMEIAFSDCLDKLLANGNLHVVHVNYFITKRLP